VVTGAGGMLGRAVLAQFAATRVVTAQRRADCDLADRDATLRWFEAQQPRLIVHCAAWADVDGCEADPERAWRDNAEAARNVALAAAATGAALVHVSTDYVFAGDKATAYVEDDAPAPLGIYGRTKHAAEEHVQRHAPRAWIVRTSWLFGPGGRNFVRTIAGLVAVRDEIRVVDDQRGCPTYTHDLAAALAVVSGGLEFGIYHLTNAGACSWFELATAIAARLGSGCRVVPCTTAEFPRPAPRPRNSVLDASVSRARGAPVLRHWHAALDDYLAILALEAKP
jgi:dTDP-4-dehydrorhamnose reductase